MRLPTAGDQPIFFGFVEVSIFGSQHEHRRPDTWVSKLGTERESIDPGKRDVEDDDIVLVLVGEPLAVGSGRYHVDGESLSFQVARIAAAAFFSSSKTSTRTKAPRRRITNSVWPTEPERLLRNSPVNHRC